MKKAALQLETLTCPSCIKKIETTLNKTAGVESVTVLFNSSKVKVQFNDAQIEPNQIEATIKNLGYEVLAMKVS
jgi:copper chaperone